MLISWENEREQPAILVDSFQSAATRLESK